MFGSFELVYTAYSIFGMAMLGGTLYLMVSESSRAKLHIRSCKEQNLCEPSISKQEEDGDSKK